MAASDATTITNLSAQLGCANDPMTVALTLEREIGRALVANANGSFKDGGTGGVQQMQRLVQLIRTVEGFNTELIARATQVIAEQAALLTR